ncbi:DUF418 domain-containing protein [Microbacterium sp. KSW4-17]|uniref:DUF418 domain-containing protein n=1 Tax=Microbacterium galbum TaxID=3075994 RepID=A0ABU3T7Z6_9MICO|nr:DUF418 domain-containing protein [Microbacterium sp. KSW4-17]MDU0367463.1 DUF418 domain-containing protein [Microbacterium sp. KSW4-17]
MNNTNVLPGPTGPRRIDTLDVVRGIALIGTLATNIWVFSHPWGLWGMLDDPVLPDESAGAATTQLVLMALAQGKFLALLSLTFGVGLAIQHRAARRRARRWPGRYLWRATLLFVDGVVNYVLIAEFDVLMGYAVTAAVVSVLLLTRPRAQRAMILAFGALHLALISALVLLLTAVPGADVDAGLPAGPSPYATESFLGLALFRLDNVAVFRAEPVLIGFLSVAMFLTGAALWRAEVFGDAGARVRRRLMTAGAVAAPIDVALALTASPGGLLLERYVVAPVVALGILGLVAELCLRRGTEGWFARRGREVGRVALSAYLLQNLLGGALFYGWGLGVAESAQAWRVPVTVLAFVVITGVVAVSAHLWLRRFALGPVEWLWRAAAEGRRPRLEIPHDRPRASSAVAD